jgi:predicted RNA-binding Zn ribbon-like protein
MARVGHNLTDGFLLAGGRPCLDLALTGGLEGWRRAFESLQAPADLTRWFAVAPPGLSRVRVTAADVRAAKELREAVWHLVDAVLGGSPLPAHAVAVVNAQAARPDLAPRLLAAGSSGLADPTPRRALAGVARDAVRLFGDPAQVRRVRECAAADCRIVFYDDSRPGTRRWCAPNRCGDRLRARAYRARHRIEERSR